jgi:hypothetical protein
MDYWEIEKGRDGQYDLFKNGHLVRTALTSDEVRDFFDREKVDLEDVSGYRNLAA